MVVPEMIDSSMAGIWSCQEHIKDVCRSFGPTACFFRRVLSELIPRRPPSDATLRITWCIMHSFMHNA